LTVTIGSTVVVSDVVVDFGDGEVIPLGAINGVSQSVQHVYGDPGTYVASVIATTPDGAQTKRQTPVVVAPFLLSVTCPSTIGVNAPATFSATVTPPGVLIRNYTWNFGDGTVVSGGPTISHPFQSPATTQLVNVTVNPTKGSSVSTQCSFPVTGAAK